VSQPQVDERSWLENDGLKAESPARSLAGSVSPTPGGRIENKDCAAFINNESIFHLQNHSRFCPTSISIMQKLTVHPELKTLQFPHKRADAKHLSDSIRRNGCYVPILVWKGIVIDGHRRYAICKKHKIPFKIAEADFKSIEDAKLWIYETLMSEEERQRVERPQPTERSEKPVPDEYVWIISGSTTNVSNEKHMMISLDKIRIDLDTQARVKICQKTIKDYIKAMKRGVDFPAIRVFQISDSEEYVLVDGFHRYYSYMEVRPTMKVAAWVKKGTLEEARWASVAMNQKHGLQLNAADKKKSITQVLLSEQGAKMSNRQIADYLGLDESTVRRLRRKMESTAALPQSTERIGKDGRVIKTEKIGKGNSDKSFENKILPQNDNSTDDSQDVKTAAGTHEQIIIDEDDESVSTMTFTLLVERTASRLVEHFFTYFRSGFVNDLVMAAVEVMDEKVAPGATQRLLDELNERFGKRPVPTISPVILSETDCQKNVVSDDTSVSV